MFPDDGAETGMAIESNISIEPLKNMDGITFIMKFCLRIYPKKMQKTKKWN